MGVTTSVDSRAYPIELAKQMLNLAGNLNMSAGPTAYYEAETKLNAFIESLNVYFKVTWPDYFKGQDFTKQRRTIERFVTLKQESPMLKQAIARQLLDCINYFPVAEDKVIEPIYLEEASDERTGS